MKALYKITSLRSLENTLTLNKNAISVWFASKTIALPKTDCRCPYVFLLNEVFFVRNKVELFVVLSFFQVF